MYHVQIARSCDLTHVLVSAGSIRAPDSTAGAISTVSAITVVTGLSTVLLHVIHPAVRLAVVGPLVAVRVDVLAVRVRVGTGVGVVTIRRSIVGGRVRSGVGVSGTLQTRIAGPFEELTVVVTTSKPDVSSVSPGGTPGVFDKDVFGGISDHGDSMVSVSTAGGVPQDLSTVLEEPVGYLESNTDGGELEDVNVGSLTLTDTDSASDLVSFHGVGFLVVITSAVNPLVAVILGGGKTSTILGTPGITSVYPSSVTTVILSLENTIKILLLGKVPQNSRLDSVGGLDTSNCTESPARSTTSLILDGGNFSLGGPEQLAGVANSAPQNVINRSGGHGGDVETQVPLLLSGSHGRELVEGVDSSILSILVVVSYMLGVSSEDPEPHDIFSSAKF